MYAIRVPVSVLAGAALSVALFLGLWQLVSVPFSAGPTVAATIIDFTPQRKDTPAENKRDEKVTREPPPAQPGRPTFSRGGGVDVGAVFHAPPLAPDVPKGNHTTSGIDADATPLVRMNPEYPPRAANTEGWVQVRFSVTTAGTVRDAVVIASEPGTIFDEAALKAVARWRYNPRVVDGVAVERVGLETVFRFELE